MNHATVKLGDYTCPLIGIPVSATEEKCDGCGGIRHIRLVRLQPDGKFQCYICEATASLRKSLSEL